MHAFRRRHYRWLKHLPRRKNLKGGRLHRLLGDKLFARELWKPSRETIARGLALGLFIGFTPTMGIQIILTGLAAYFLKVNIPIALAGSLVTNPFTAGIVYPLRTSSECGSSAYRMRTSWKATQACWPRLRATQSHCSSAAC